MIDSTRRTVLATGAAAAAASAVPQVFAQAQPAGAVPGLPAGAKVGFYEKGNVRIRYAEIGSGFPLLATPGGGLNSRIAVWARAVINIPEEFKNDFASSPWTSATPPAASPRGRSRSMTRGTPSLTTSWG